MAVGQQDRGSGPGDAESAAGQGKHRRPAARSVDDLLRRTAHGDAEAFAGICDQVSGAVYGVVSRIVADQSRAEQVTEDVLVEVWQSAAQFSPARGSGLNWIMTLARRRARSQAGDGPAAAPAGVTVKEAAGTLAAYRGITSLPGPQREAVLMASCGYTWRQVAELAGAPADAAAQWLRDGLLGLSGRPE